MKSLTGIKWFGKDGKELDLDTELGKKYSESSPPPWSVISGKPATFPPEGHNQGWDTITGKPVTATRWPTWDEVTDKPSSFNPAAHSHSWDSITSKPSTFPPPPEYIKSSYTRLFLHSVLVEGIYSTDFEGFLIIRVNDLSEIKIKSYEELITFANNNPPLLNYNCMGILKIRIGDNIKPFIPFSFYIGNSAYNPSYFQGIFFDTVIGTV